MVIRFNKKNPLLKDLYSKKYDKKVFNPKRVEKQKKGKGSFKRKKK